MKNRILKIAQNQMGSAHLEVAGSRSLLRSFISKWLQVIAMTRLPLGSKFRCSVERMRGVKIGKHVFLGGDLKIAVL